MQYSLLAIAALASTVAAASNGTYHASVVWVTDIVTDFTTFCPASTTFSAYGQTYTVTEATTIVLPCPCTSSYLVTPTTAAAPVTTASGYPVSSAVVSPVYVNSTQPASGVPATPVVPATPIAPTSAGTTVPVAPAKTSAFTGAANSMAAPAGALVGVLGLAAYFL